MTFFFLQQLSFNKNIFYWFFQVAIPQVATTPQPPALSLVAIPPLIISLVITLVPQAMATPTLAAILGTTLARIQVHPALLHLGGLDTPVPGPKVIMLAQDPM